MKTKASLFLNMVCFAVLLVCPVSADLSSSISEILSRPNEGRVGYGIHIIDADTGRQYYDKNAYYPFIPASNMKLITTAAALNYLGPDYVYQTTVGLDGNTLVIIGSGDPLLGDRITDVRLGRESGWVFEEIAQALIHNDVSGIENIIVDTTIFDDQRVHPNWPVAELNRWYACEISGLNYNDNCVEITCYNRSGNIDIEVYPTSGFLNFINKITPISSGSGAVGAYRTDTLNSIILRGKCRVKQGPFRVAIERPAAFFAFLLAERLKEHDISVRGQIIEKGPVDKTNLKIIKTFNTPISDCLARANKDSLGLVAESLLKTIAANENDNQNGSWPQGQKLIADYLGELKIRPNRFHIDDGSGLSRENRLSADCITTVLRSIYKSRNFEIYKQSLSVGGIDGTNSRHFQEPEYKGKIIGKTGYINGVKSFSGYCITDDKTYIFSIIANSAGGTTRQAINDIAKAIIDNKP
ncbi:MAG: D-alanyl-D-alanine carboxypeptidase/D-alanyl-D-alanine-endopeptidase [Phycisphaerae bacterium]|jgi:D-alanyl-D-alanine carboxypeptidase/D-alanyl-D-alanine-endopeptidase (penicillin-binding protein 4)